MQPIPDRLQAALADRYRLEREVGQGGMATVYLAEDLKHHRRVACEFRATGRGIHCLKVVSKKLSPRAARKRAPVLNQMADTW